MSNQDNLRVVRERLAQLDPNNRDHLVEIAHLRTQENELSKAAALEETEAELKAQHEERVKESVEQIITTFDSVVIEGFALRELFLDEARYQLASIWIKKQFEEQADNFSKQIQSEQLEGKQLREEISEQEGIIGALKDEVHQIKVERDQAILYRDNAHAQLEEARTEVKRLEEHVDLLRIEAAVGAKNAFKVTTTNISGSKELAEQIRASLIPVTDIERVDGRTIIVTYPDGRKEKDHPNYVRKYRIIDEEEAARFRAEQAAQERVEESVASHPALVDEPEPPTFQTTPDDVEGLGGVQQSASARTVGVNGEADKDAGTQSLQERVAALEAHCFGYVKGVA